MPNPRLGEVRPLLLKAAQRRTKSMNQELGDQVPSSSFIHKYLLNSYYAPGIFPGPGSIMVTRTVMVPAFLKLKFTH